MAGLVPAIQVFKRAKKGRRGCPDIGERERRRPSDGYVRAGRWENYPPRIGGIVTWSRRQARRSISSQARNCRSLLMQIRTSLSRALLQVTAMAEVLRPGLTLMKASSISAGGTAFGV